MEESEWEKVVEGDFSVSENGAEGERKGGVNDVSTQTQGDEEATIRGANSRSVLIFQRRGTEKKIKKRKIISRGIFWVSTESVGGGVVYQL